MGAPEREGSKSAPQRAWFQAIVGGTADAYIGVNLLGTVVVFNRPPKRCWPFGFGASGRAIEDSGLPTDRGAPSAMRSAKFATGRR